MGTNAVFVGCDMGRKCHIDFSKPLRSARQEAFCRAYTQNINQTGSARIAKYSEVGITGTASKLMNSPYIKGRLAYLQGELVEKSGVNSERVIAEVAKIAFCNVQSFLDEGNEIRDISQLPPDVAAAVESIQVDIRHDGGDSKGYTEKVKFKLHSKLTALNDLCKHLGLFGEDNGQKGDKTVVIMDFGQLNDSRPIISE